MTCSHRQRGWGHLHAALGGSYNAIRVRTHITNALTLGKCASIVTERYPFDDEVKPSHVHVTRHHQNTLIYQNL